MQEKHFKPV